MNDVTEAPAPRVERAAGEAPALKEKDFGESGYAYARMQATLVQGTTLKTAMQPEYWRLVAHKLAASPVLRTPDRVGTIIEMRTEDHAFYAEAYVMAVQEKGLILRLMRHDVFHDGQSIESDKHRVRYNPGAKSYDVVRKSDNSIVAKGLKTKEHAQAWIDQE